MMTIPRSAGGAAAYSRADTWAAGSSSAVGFAVIDPRDDWPRQWSVLIDGLRAARQLEDDWDGQGAVAPAPALVDGAITLAQTLRVSGARPADFAIPGVNGTVVFEWHHPVEYVEVEVVEPGRYVHRAVRSGLPAAEAYFQI